MNLDTAELLTWPDSRLNREAQSLSLPEENLPELLRLMEESLVEHNAIGLAAPQLNIPVRLFVLAPGAYEQDDPKPDGIHPLAFINPIIISSSEEHTIGRESCISLAVPVLVKRPATISLKAQAPNGQEFTMTAQKVLGRIIQHEIDHLDGIMTVDHVGSVQRNLVRRKVQKQLRRQKRRQLDPKDQESAG